MFAPSLTSNLQHLGFQQSSAVSLIFSLETGNTVLLKKCLLFKLLLLIIYYFICPCSAHFIYIPAESLCNPPGDDFLGVDCVTPVNERFPIFGRFSHQSSITCVCKQGFEGIANKLLIN